MRRLIFGLGGLAMSGCMLMNPITAVQLATMNPLEADPSVMAVRLVLPDGVDVVAGTAEVRLDVTNGAGEALAGRYPLERLDGNIWRVAWSVQDDMRADIATARAWDQADPDGTSGSFGAGFEPCAVAGGPDDGARFTMALQVEPGGAFLPLFDDVRLSRLYDAETVGRLDPCE